MSRLVLLVALALACAACRSKREQVLDLTPEQRAELERRVQAGVDELVKLLELTPEQEAKFRPVVEADFERRRQVLLDYKDEPRNYFTLRRIRADLDAVSDETQEKLAEFLSSAQIGTLDRYLDEKREQAIEEFRKRRAAAG